VAANDVAGTVAEPIARAESESKAVFFMARFLLAQSRYWTARVVHHPCHKEEASDFKRLGGDTRNRPHGE
jgi:hypothetical protein